MPGPYRPRTYRRIRTFYRAAQNPSRVPVHEVLVVIEHGDLVPVHERCRGLIARVMTQTFCGLVPPVNAKGPFISLPAGSPQSWVAALPLMNTRALGAGAANAAIAMALSTLVQL